MRRLAYAVLLPAGAFALACTTADAAITITVDKTSQRMTVAQDSRTLYSWPVSTGKRGYATPSGDFRAFRMEKDHFSREWDEAPMPHSIFFTKKGSAPRQAMAACGSRPNMPPRCFAWCRPTAS
jgi:hypothetical protein